MRCTSPVRMSGWSRRWHNGICRMIHLRPSDTRCANLPVRAPFLLRNLRQTSCLLLSLLQQQTPTVKLENAIINRLVILTMPKPIRVLLKNVRRALCGSAELLDNLFDGSEIQLLDKHRWSDSVLRPEISFDLRKLAILKMTAQKMAGLMELGKTNPPRGLLQIACNEAKVTPVRGERERDAARALT